MESELTKRAGRHARSTRVTVAATARRRDVRMHLLLTAWRALMHHSAKSGRHLRRLHPAHRAAR